jgi:hypothetical protein
VKNVRDFRFPLRGRRDLRSAEKLTQRIVVIPHRHFGKTYRSHLQVLVIQEGQFKAGPIGCLETSVRNCHYTLRKFLRGAQISSVSVAQKM